MALLLAPFAGAVATVCECAHGAEVAAEIGAVPCCEGNDQCCYEHKEDDQTSPLLAELNRQNRVDPTEGLQSVSQLLPAPVTLVVRSYHAIRDTEPIKTQVLERSLHQSWLI